MQRSHQLVKIIVALCVTLPALSACDESADGESTVTSAEMREQDDQQPQETSEETSGNDDEKAQTPSGARDVDLDTYVAKAEKAVRRIYGDAFEEMYSQVDIVAVHPNGIEYDYTFRAAVDPALAKPQLDAQAPTLRTQARTVVIPEMEGLGFAAPTVTYTYRNPNGSVVWSRTIARRQ